MVSYKSISFIDRCLNPVYRIKFDVPKRVSFITKRVKSLDSNIGKIVTKLEKCVNNNDVLKNLTYNDFSLENLIEIGAVGNLQPIVMQGNKFDSLRNIQMQLAQLSVQHSNDK